MKHIIIVPDGMADEPVGELRDKTPLEVARTPNMDYLAQHGRVGLVATIPKGMKPGSDVGNMSILGYNPAMYHCGRAPLEAANLDVTLAEDEIAFRCNLVTVFNGKMADYSAGHISTKEARLLIESLNAEVNLDAVKFVAGKSYRHLLVLKTRNPKVFAEIEIIPPHDIAGQNISDHLPQGAEAGMLLKLMEQSQKVFEKHSVNQVRMDLEENPANMIWLWGQGVSPKLPSFSEKFGIKGAMISAVDLVNGLGRLAGLEVIDVPGITGYYDTNYLGKAQYAIKALKTRDLVYVHIESPDEAGHNGDINAKIDCIEKIDKEIIGTILDHFKARNDARILVLPDHPTPVELKKHTSDPVGFVMFGKGIEQNMCEMFNEKAAREKGLVFAGGEELIDNFMMRNL